MFAERALVFIRGTRHLFVFSDYIVKNLWFKRINFFAQKNQSDQRAQKAHKHIPLRIPDIPLRAQKVVAG